MTHGGQQVIITKSTTLHISRIFWEDKEVVVGDSMTPPPPRADCWNGTVFFFSYSWGFAVVNYDKLLFPHLSEDHSLHNINRAAMFVWEERSSLPAYSCSKLMHKLKCSVLYGGQRHTKGNN